MLGSNGLALPGTARTGPARLGPHSETRVDKIVPEREREKWGGALSIDLWSESEKNSSLSFNSILSIYIKKNTVARFVRAMILL